MARLTGLYGGCLLLSAMFPPDPVPDFPVPPEGCAWGSFLGDYAPRAMPVWVPGPELIA